MAACGHTGEDAALYDTVKVVLSNSSCPLSIPSKNFANNAMLQFDNVVELFNEKYGKPAQAIMQELYSDNLLTPLPFDEPLELTYWNLWHNSGTLARHGAAMGSPSMTWKGINEVLLIVLLLISVPKQSLQNAEET